MVSAHEGSASQKWERNSLTKWERKQMAKIKRWHETIIVNSIINFNELCTIASRTSKHVRFLTHNTHQQQQHKIEAANAEFEFAVLKNNEMWFKN